MTSSDQIDLQISSLLQRLGVGGPREIIDELDDIPMPEIELALERLVRQGDLELIQSPGRAYRVARPRIDWARHAGKVTVIHNDPIDIMADAHKACNLHPAVEHANLEAVFSALVGGAQEQLQIISPFIDSRALSRFSDDFEKSFARHIEFTLVGRGILVREDSTRPRQYEERIDALQNLWDSYKRNNPDDPTHFEIRDYLRFVPPPAENLRARGAIAASVHHKIIVQDRKWAYVGSGEFRNHSFGATGEAGVLLDGPHAKMLSDLVQCYARRGLPVDPLELDALRGGSS
ncbi:MAG: hypothetical protein WB789_08240 [Thermoplasmata archaeon]